MSARTCPHGLAKIALQLPASHAQWPPQSRVLGAHCIVHITSVQSGFCAAGTQLAGWQHEAGTQSASTLHWPSLPSPPAVR
jgi:hypothetical protein